MAPQAATSLQVKQTVKPLTPVELRLAFQFAVSSLLAKKIPSGQRSASYATKRDRKLAEASQVVGVFGGSYVSSLCFIQVNSGRRTSAIASAQSSACSGQEWLQLLLSLACFSTKQQ